MKNHQKINFLIFKYFAHNCNYLVIIYIVSRKRQVLSRIQPVIAATLALDEALPFAMLQMSRPVRWATQRAVIINVIMPVGQFGRTITGRTASEKR